MGPPPGICQAPLAGFSWCGAGVARRGNICALWGEGDPGFAAGPARRDAPWVLTDPAIQAVALWLAAFLAAAAAWPVRKADPWSRAGILACIAAFCFALPLFYREGPVLLRVVTVLLCPVWGGKLLDLGVAADWWENKTFGDWL